MRSASTHRPKTQEHRLPVQGQRPDAWSARRGFSISELLFAVTAVSGLSVLTITVIGLLVSAEQHSAEALWVSATISDLANDLRTDAHQATEVRYADPQEGHILQVTFVPADGRELTYSCSAEGVTRIQGAGPDIESRQFYRLAFGESWFDSVQNGILRWNHVRDVPGIGGYSEPQGEDTTARRHYAVNAAVGLHAIQTDVEAP